MIRSEGQLPVTRMVHCFLMLALLCLAAAPVARAEEGANPARLLLDPPLRSIAAGEHRTLEVRVEGIPVGGLSAFQVVLAFDPNRLEVRDPNAKYVAFGIDAFAPLGHSPLCAAVRETAACPDSAWMLTTTGREALGTTSIDAEAGVVSIAYATEGTEPLAQGDGT
ncbi:unnamed protein product, partial [marine sediment metagenome]